MKTEQGNYIVTTAEVASCFMKTQEYKEYFEKHCLNNHILLTVDVKHMSLSTDNSVRSAIIVVEISACSYPLEQGVHIPHLCELYAFGEYSYNIIEQDLRYLSF